LGSDIAIDGEEWVHPKAWGAAKNFPRWFILKREIRLVLQRVQVCGDESRCDAEAAHKRAQ
jgi:hypothetical protein